MSGLAQAKQKLQQGSEWRGTITVSINGEDVELSVRQLPDPKMEEVMDLLDFDEIRDLQDEYPEDVRDELAELREKDSLTEEEQERRSELQAAMEAVDVDVFEYLSQDTFEAVRRAAIYGVEPDREDMEHAMRERAHEIEREYGVQVNVPEDTYEALTDEWEERVRNATNFVSFEIGMKVLKETADDEGNSES